MLALKRVVTVAVMVYLLLALLFLLFPAVRSSISEMGSGVTPAENESKALYVLAFIGVVVMALHLLTENIDSTVLRRTVSQQDNKINELKAKLYDTHHAVNATPTASTTAYPPAEPDAPTRRLPDEPTATPPTY